MRVELDVTIAEKLISIKAYKNLSTGESLERCPKQKISDAKACELSDCFEGEDPARLQDGGSVAFRLVISTCGHTWLGVPYRIVTQ